MFIFHITLRSDWEQAGPNGFYRPTSLDDEGFIHCSTAGQVLNVGDCYYHGVSGLVLLKIDTGKLDIPLKFEDSHQNGELFPHLYGPLAVNAVVAVGDFSHGLDGSFIWPQGLPKD